MTSCCLYPKAWARRIFVKATNQLIYRLDLRAALRVRYTESFRDTWTPIGDARMPIGDSRAPVGDTAMPIGDTRMVIGDIRTRCQGARFVRPRRPKVGFEKYRRATEQFRKLGQASHRFPHRKQENRMVRLVACRMEKLQCLVNHWKNGCLPHRRSAKFALVSTLRFAFSSAKPWILRVLQ